MIPIRDDNPVRGLPVVTVFLILTCMGVYLWQLSLPPEGRQEATTLLGFMPGVLFGYARIEGGPWVSPAVSIFTAMFLHGDFFHLAANLLYLWIFGDNVEDRFGHLKFLIFYLLSGIAAANTAVCAAAPPAIARQTAIAKTKLFIVSSWAAF